MAPIENGTINGKFNATIQGGVAYPSVHSNGTVQDITIVVWGEDDQGDTFLINEAGVRTDAAQQVTRVVSMTCDRGNCPRTRLIARSNFGLEARIRIWTRLWRVRWRREV